MGKHINKRPKTKTEQMHILLSKEDADFIYKKAIRHKQTLTDLLIKGARNYKGNSQ
jgi:hypothetical protein